MMSTQLFALQDIGLGTLCEEYFDGDTVYTYNSSPPPHPVRWNKSRGQPDCSRLVSHPCVSREASFTMSLDDDDRRSTCTPYRLPRISPRGGERQDDAGSAQSQSEPDQTADDRKTPASEKVWSRYGYEKIVRIPELGPQIKTLVPPPRTYLQQSPRHQTASRLKHAAITPTCRSMPGLPWHQMGPEDDDSQLQMYKSSHSRIHDDDMSTRSTRLEPTPTPISRSDSPAKSVKSIHWILGHNRYHTFDKKGRSHVQGPYSREFNVTCMAPQNWLKMKWGRSKTMIH